MEILQTSNSKGKFLLTPMGSRFYLVFLIISWWVLHMWILPAKFRSLTQLLQHWKILNACLFPKWHMALQSVHMCPHVIELKFFISNIISHFSQRKTSTVCHYALGLYHSLATNRHWAKLQKKNRLYLFWKPLKTGTLSFVLLSTLSALKNTNK